MIRVAHIYLPHLSDDKNAKYLEDYINKHGITKNDIVQFIANDSVSTIFLVYEDSKPYIPETESTESESSSPQ